MSVYDIKKNPDGHIGYAIIINNYSFVNPITRRPEPRKGSEIDVLNIIKSLQNVNIYTREPFVDKTATEMKEIMSQFARQGDFSNYSCFICVIMSHGSENHQILGVDSQPAHLLNDLVGPFKECVSLQGKPKLFFVNACRGEHTPTTFEVVERENGTLLDVDTIDALMRKRRVPNEADILIHYSSVESYYSYRNTSRGSYFIESVCHELNASAGVVNSNLNDMLVDVNNRVASRYSDGQMPQILNQLRKRFYLNFDEGSLAFLRGGINNGLNNTTRPVDFKNLESFKDSGQYKEKKSVVKWGEIKSGSVDNNLFASHDPDSVKELNISKRNIKLIMPDAFAELKNLTVLNLKKNQIEIIEISKFNGLVSLKELDMSNNKVKSIPPDTFSKLNQLELLNLTKNKMEFIDLNAFNGLESLKELDISMNKIKFIPAKAFSGLKNVQQLNLEGNNLQLLKDTSFNGLVSLKTLNISRNKIKVIPAKTFSELKSLEQLDLKENSLEEIDKTKFEGLVSLKLLNITRNKIKFIPSDTFNNLESLETLLLDGGIVRNQYFAGLDSLKLVNTRSLHPVRSLFNSQTSYVLT
jgi:Leucine-rich repeat (LRR) protein